MSGSGAPIHDAADRWARHPYGGGVAALPRSNSSRSGTASASRSTVVHPSVAVGEIFGILGLNGAGKTTTVECAQGLRRPDGGAVRLLGRDPQRERSALASRVGSQLQDSNLPERMRVSEAVGLFADRRGRARSASCSAAVLPNARAAQGVGLLLFLPSFLLAGGGPPPDSDVVSDERHRHCAPAHPRGRAIEEPWLGLGTGTEHLVVVVEILLVVGAALADPHPVGFDSARPRERRPSGARRSPTTLPDRPTRGRATEPAEGDL